MKNEEFVDSKGMSHLNAPLISALVASSRDIFVAMDSNGIIADINPAGERYFGWSAQEAMGAPFAEIVVHQDGRAEFSKFLQEFLNSQEKNQDNDFLEVNAVHRNGFQFPAEVTFTKTMGETGTVVGLFLRNIQRHKQTEHDLLQAREAADIADFTKSAFLANMSHEIRTPLGAVLGFSELMTNPAIQLSEKTNYLSAIKRNGELLSNLISDILDLSKVEAGKLEVRTKRVNLKEMMGEVSNLLNLIAREKGISLTFGSEGPIPTYINTDASRLKQVLLNIIGNAVKFTEKGFVRVRIKLASEDLKNAKLSFQVVDSGTGLRQDQISKLFEPFSQADISPTRRFGGAGLGLALSRRLAVLLGGNVVLNGSLPGRGSTFTVTIDVGDLTTTSFEIYDGETATQPSLNTAAPRADIRLDGLRILVVDDAPDNRMLVSRILKIAGALVDTAENGEEALLKISNNNYDITLLDLQMPVKDGYETIRELRAGGCVKPVIALTAHALKEEYQRCIQSGFTDHLSKPINRQALIERVFRFSSKTPLQNMPSQPPIPPITN